MIVMRNQEGEELHCERVDYASMCDNTVKGWLCYNVYNIKKRTFVSETWAGESDWDIAYEYYE